MTHTKSVLLLAPSVLTHTHYILSWLRNFIHSHTHISLHSRNTVDGEGFLILEQVRPQPEPRHPRPMRRRRLALRSGSEARVAWTHSSSPRLLLPPRPGLGSSSWKRVSDSSPTKRV